MEKKKRTVYEAEVTLRDFIVPTAFVVVPFCLVMLIDYLF